MLYIIHSRLSFPFRRGREDGRSSTSSLPPTILTYEAVQEIDLEFTRPVIVLGPLKDRVNDDLMREVCDTLASFYQSALNSNSIWFGLVLVLNDSWS